VLLAGCSRDAQAPAAKPAPKSAPPVAAAPAPPPRPEGADQIDAALTEVQLFNASAVESLADIKANQTKLRSLAAKAADTARHADAGATAAQRAALAKAFADTLAEREATHAALGASLDAFRTTLPQVSDAADAATILCQPIPGLAAAAAAPAVAGGAPPLPVAPETYEGCVALAKERQAFAANVSALSKAFEAAEAAYKQDRAKLDEASATIALLR
jgi:hypothetical protein